jgi:urease accessory protein
MAFVYMQNPTGGVFPDDVLRMEVTAERGTAVHVTTPAATKIYKGDGATARCELVFQLGNDAYLEYVPEPLIPHAGSRYLQTTRVDLSSGSSFVAIDRVAPGRFARGESFEYDLLDLRTEVYGSDGRELCVDRLLLEPSRVTPDRRGLFGALPYMATILVVTLDRDPEELADQIGDAVSAFGGASQLPFSAGVIARILAPNSSALRETVAAGWRVARRVLRGSELPTWRK